MKTTAKTTAKNPNVCMACACPCDKHKEHTHGADAASKDGSKKGGKTCSICGSSDTTCGCNA